MQAAVLPDDTLHGAAQAFLQSIRTASVPEHAHTGMHASLQAACDASTAALRRLVTLHYNQREQQQQGSQDQDISAHRQGVLDNLMQRLDTTARTLNDMLDDVADLGPAQHLPDPLDVISYAHRLRFTTFAKMGTISLPPAPQPWQLAQSMLYRFGMAHSAKQAAQQQQQAAVMAAKQEKQEAPATQQPTAVPAALVTAAPEYGQGYTLLDGSVVPTQLPPSQQPPPIEPVTAAPPPVIQPPREKVGGIDLGLILNADMEEVYSDTTSEEDSDDDY